MNSEILYKTYKPLLFSIAYSMIGSVESAEDMVQDVFLSFHSKEILSEKTNIGNMKAYLCKMVTNRCLDYLKSAQKKREVYIGPWLPEPLVQQCENNQFQTLLLEEEISFAFLVMLQQLTPIERAVFILKSTFNFDYKTIAATVNKSEANCRKIYSRCQSKIQTDQVDQSQDPERLLELVQKFLFAAATGNITDFVQLLTDDIVVYSDGGGKVFAALNPISTKPAVTSFLFGLSNSIKDISNLQFAIINGNIGLIISEEEFPTIICFETKSDAFKSIYIVRNPDKMSNYLKLITKS